MIYLALKDCIKLCQCDKMWLQAFQQCFISLLKTTAAGAAFSFWGADQQVSLLHSFILPASAVGRNNPLPIWKANQFKWKFSCMHLNPVRGGTTWMVPTGRAESLGKFLICITLMFHFLTKKSSCWSNYHNILWEDLYSELQSGNRNVHAALHKAEMHSPKFT